VKNDYRDAADLADLLRMGRLPEAWVAPVEVRDRRELVRHRHKIVGLRTSLKAQVHAVLAKRGIPVVDSDLSGVRGRKRLASMALPEPFRIRVESQLRLIEAIDAEVDQFDRLIAKAFLDDDGYRVIQQLPGVGPTFAAVFTAELGDVSRFAGAPQVCSWAGLTPRHRESDNTVHRGSITKQGSRLVRWAAVEAVQRAPKASPMRLTYDRIVAAPGRTSRRSPLHANS
jgi:transposase